MTTETIALISALAAAASAIFALLTIRTMNKQNRLSMIPELSILIDDLFFYTDVNKIPVDVYEGVKTSGIRPRIKIINIGKGSAKEIESMFFFDVAGSLNCIVSESTIEDEPEFNFNVSKTRNFLEKCTVNVSVQNRYEYLLNEYHPLFLEANVEHRRKISALLTEHETFVDMPNDYLLLLSFFTYYKAQMLKKINVDTHVPLLSGFPKIGYYISYKNILNKKIVKKFELSCRLSEWNNSNELDEDQLVGKGYFEIVETTH